MTTPKMSTKSVYIVLLALLPLFGLSQDESKAAEGEKREFFEPEVRVENLILKISLESLG